MISVNYSYDKTYSGNRPYADVKIVGVGKPNICFSALVDTGADYLQIPEYSAVRAGLNVSSASNIQVRGATGTAVLKLLNGAAVIVEGKSITVDLLLEPGNGSSAFLGRQALLAAVEAGFDAKRWMWEF